MRNKLTFAAVIGILLENKKKTYPQHQLVRSLFSAYLDDELTAADLISDDTIMYSRWCSGARPIPLDIIRCYEEGNSWDTMTEDFRNKIIPNLINETHARSLTEELIRDSVSVIGSTMADELCSIQENASFFTAVIRYAVLNDHKDGRLFSPDLSNLLLSAKLPSCTREFIGRKAELKEAEKLLAAHSLLFVSGIAGIGKSEFAKAFAEFFRHCPSSQAKPDTVAAIIKEVKYHTLTVCMAALTLEASGMEPEELLLELKSCGLNLNSSEEIEIYKDEEFQYARMMEHLRRLLQLNQLDFAQDDILRNLSLLPLAGMCKADFRKWLRLENANEINHLIRYGYITEDCENRKIALHPLIQEVVLLELHPSVSTCKTMLDSLHLICLAHGLDVQKPQNVIVSLISINDHIINDWPEYYLLFLQDLFPYFDKYLVTDYLPRLASCIEYVMNESKLLSACDKALLLDYKAELLIPHKEYDNAIKKRKKAIVLIEKYHELEISERSLNLLSNIYNNLSNVYLLQNKKNEAIEALKSAFEVRKALAARGFYETHDQLQQLMNLVNMLILSKEYSAAENLTTLYEELVLKHLGKDCLDYGVCQLTKGILAYGQGRAKDAELYFLSAESIFQGLLNEDNYYSKTVYRYLYNLYGKCGKLELAAEFRSKLHSNN